MKREKIIDLINTFMENIDKGNFDEALSVFHDDIVFKHPKAWDFEKENPEFHGIEEFRSYWEKRGFKNITHEVKDVIVEGNKAALLGVTQGPEMNDMEHGVQKYTFIGIMEFKDGKISSYIYGSCPEEL